MKNPHRNSGARRCMTITESGATRGCGAWRDGTHGFGEEQKLCIHRLWLPNRLVGLVFEVSYARAAETDPPQPGWGGVG